MTARGPERGTDRGDHCEPAPATAQESGREDHDATGLDLARSVARALARRAPGAPGTGRRRSPTDRPGSSQPGVRGEPRFSGSHPDDRDPQSLDTTLGRLLAEQGWEGDLRVHAVFAHWDAIVGREVAEHVRPVSYAREESQARLVVQTDSTAWATQMRLLAATVVRRLNAELGDGSVSVIDVRGPGAPNWRKGRRFVRGGRGPRDTYG